MTSKQMDESILSRQLYTIGKEAQIKMMNTRVLIVGLNGIGVEIAKNIILMTVKSVGLLDNRKAVIADLGTNFFLQKEHIGQVISESIVNQLQELNNTVAVNVEKSEIYSEEIYKDYDVIVLCQLLSKQESIKIDELCRKNNVKMVYAVNRGPFSMIFNDFGDDFVVFDSNGETEKSFIVNEVVEDSIQFIEDNFCDLDVGNEVKFEEFEGLNELNYSQNGGKSFKITERTPYSVKIGNLSNYTKYVKGGKMIEIKPIVTLHYKPLKERLTEAGEISFTNMSKMDRLYGYHGLFHALMVYLDKYGTSPKTHDFEDYKKFKEITDELKVELDESFIKIFCYCNNGFFSPLDTTFGGIAAQEVLKAASGKYTPYCQFAFYDCMEILPDNYLELPKEEFIDNGRYSGQIDIIGKTLQKQIEDSSIFLVGSGAIGCEVLKTWAMMGVAVGNGLIHVTDNDNIEKSNLSRQFLFRNRHINQPKSKVAANVIKEMNPDIHINDYQLRVCSETENVFDCDFYKSLTAVTTALDNVQARMYCDSQCVLYKIAMIEGGTTGTKGNTQSVIPFVTQSYATGSVRDPEEKTIPMCTLHNFPNNIDHTIQWARDRFEGLFKNEIEPVENYRNNKEKFFESIEKDSPLNQLTQLNLVFENGVQNVPRDFKDCIQWARNKFDQYFLNTIQKLVTDFPENAITDEGIPFWHAPKRFPHVLEYNRHNKTIVDFIESAALLRAEIYGIPVTLTREGIASYCETLERNPLEGKIDTKDLMQSISKTKELLSQSSIASVKPIIFEKDDDNNHHIAFITACSNLRAENYCIEPADFNKTKFISGKIIPAMITTTAVVSGLQCIELYKVIQKKPLEAYHCSFLNLAIGYMDGVEPEPVKKKRLCEGVEITVWDTVVLNGDCTIEQFCNEISKRYPFEVDSITAAGMLLYCSYLPNGAKRAKQTFKEIYKEMKKEEYTNKVLSVAIAVSSEKEELPDDFEFPDVLLTF